MFAESVLETHVYGIKIDILLLIMITYIARNCKKKPDSAKPDMFVHIVAFLNQV